MSSSEHDANRRRPFSVNDLNRRTREVKIFNTTTITTTTSTSSHHDSTVSTTTICNRGNGIEHCSYPNCTHPHYNNFVEDVHENERHYNTSTRRHECSRSKSAFTTANNETNQVNYNKNDINTKRVLFEILGAKFDMIKLLIFFLFIV